MRRDYEERALDFLEQIYPFIQNCKDRFDYSVAICRFNEEFHRNVICSYGSTRIAMITSDYVIKVDYNGWGKGTFGTSADEVRMYRRAKKDGFAHLFAKIVPIRHGYDRTFYIMPRIKGIGRTKYDADNYLNGEEYTYISKHVGDLHCKNYGWQDGHIVMIDYAYNSTMWNS